MQHDHHQLGIRDIKDIESLNKVASSWIANATASTGASAENGTADCDMKKRKVVWEIKNLKGGQSK
jgi:hypothetical protein